MTGDASLFQTYNPCSENFKVRIADGSLSIVTGTGSIVISKNLILRNLLLLVPNLSCNLLSISKIRRDLKFFSTHCEFQDLDSGRMIGDAKECVDMPKSVYPNGI